LRAVKIEERKGQEGNGDTAIRTTKPQP
jgi:hypothetical protein